MKLVHPIDWQFGPDGSLYLLEYGSGYFSGAVDAGLYKINYVQGGRSPQAKATVNRDNGLAPLSVTFSSAGSSDPDGDPLTYAWDFTNNGSTDSTAANPSFTYSANGSYSARLTVNDGTGRSATTVVSVVVGNNRPTVTLTGLPAGGLFDWGQDLAVGATASDPQDGTAGLLGGGRPGRAGPPGARPRGGGGDRLRRDLQHRPGARRPRLGAVLRPAGQLHRSRRDRARPRSPVSRRSASTRNSGRPSTSSSSTAPR